MRYTQGPPTLGCTANGLGCTAASCWLTCAAYCTADPSRRAAPTVDADPCCTVAPFCTVLPPTCSSLGSSSSQVRVAGWDGRLFGVWLPLIVIDVYIGLNGGWGLYGGCLCLSRV